MRWDAANGGNASMLQREQILGGHQTPSPIGCSHGSNIRTQLPAVVDDHKGNVQLAQGFHIAELLSWHQQEDTLGASLGEVDLPVLFEPFLMVQREQRQTPPCPIQALVNPMKHFQVVLTIKRTCYNQINQLRRCFLGGMGRPLANVPVFCYHTQHTLTSLWRDIRSLMEHS